eukprot:gene37379-45388_t
MSPSSLVTFQLPVSVNSFVDQFWWNPSFYRDFLSNRLKNIEIRIDPWQQQEITSNNGLDRLVYTRTVQSDHPMDEDYAFLRVLGVIPSYAQSSREQTLDKPMQPLDYVDLPVSLTDSPKPTHTIKEKAFFRGLPFSSAFSVHTQWKISPLGAQSTQVEVEVDVRFAQRLWLAPLITRNARQELRLVLLKWADHARLQIIPEKPSKPGEL